MIIGNLAPVIFPESGSELLGKDKAKRLAATQKISRTRFAQTQRRSDARKAVRRFESFLLLPGWFENVIMQNFVATGRHFLQTIY